MIDVENGIPIPETRGGRQPGSGRKPLYPWATMGVGQSFFVPGKTRADINPAPAGKKYGRKFTARTVDGGVRVWRIE